MKILPNVEPPPEIHEQNRPCGECTKCCTVLGVPTIGKDQHTKCHLECSSGCSVYGKHPKECAAYACLWKVAGLGPASWRPDKLGLIIDAVGAGDSPIYEGLLVVGVREVHQAALEDPKARAAVDSLSVAGMTSILIRVNGSKSIVGPPESVHELAYRIRKAGQNT